MRTSEIVTGLLILALVIVVVVTVGPTPAVLAGLAVGVVVWFSTVTSRRRGRG